MLSTQSSTPQTYRIRGDYRINEGNQTLDTVSGSEYWTPARIRASSLHQYQVYEKAYRLAFEMDAETVVDIGCGAATKLNRFFAKGFTIAGIDQGSAVEISNRLFGDLGGLYLTENLECPKLVLGDHFERVDLFICADVIEHLQHPEQLMDFIRRSASDSSLIVLSTPERIALRGRQAIRPSISSHIREWAYTEFRAFVEDFGFEVMRHELLVPLRLGCNLMTAAFLADRLVRRLPLRTCQLVVCRRRS